jgi:hypothetical protein
LTNPAVFARSASCIAAAIAARTAACAATTILVFAASAGIIVLTGLGDDLRDVLRFTFDGVERTPGEVLRLAVHNGRLVAGVLVLAIVAPRLPARARSLLDGLLAALLTFNAAVIGVALGAYGWRLATATAPHLPFELAALCLAGGAYMSSSVQTLDARALTGIAVLCALLLACAATLETYVPIGDAR